jgi:hypothetical protein
LIYYFKTEYDEYQRRVLKEISREIAGSRLLGNCRLSEFESRSNGRGKPARRPREVSLLKYGAYTFQVKEDEILPRKKGGLYPSDVAAEALYYLPPEERTTCRLLEDLRSRR